MQKIKVNFLIEIIFLENVMLFRLYLMTIYVQKYIYQLECKNLSFYIFDKMESIEKLVCQTNKKSFSISD